MVHREALADLAPTLVDADRLVRAVASGRRRGAQLPRWRRVELRPVELAAGLRLQVVRHDERQAFTSNVPYGDEAVQVVAELLDQPYGNWHVVTADETIQVRITKKGTAQIHRATGRGGGADSRPPAEQRPVSRAHDRRKQRVLALDDPMLRAIGITTETGAIKPSRQDKLRQVEDFLRAFDAVLDAVPAADRPLRVVDLGCGNAYLTFAGYRFLNANRGRTASLVGVDVRPEARERNTRIAAELGWPDVTFVAGTIAGALEDRAGEPGRLADIVFALHACDTATDDAIARGVRWQAPLILAAPCCHHDIQAQLRRSAPPAPFAPVMKHGILRERLADVLTDGLRAAILRLVGYRVEVVEFVPTKHTPRNVLIRAVRTGARPTARAVADYRSLVEQWAITPRLATLLEDLLAPGVATPIARSDSVEGRHRSRGDHPTGGRQSRGGRQQPGRTVHLRG